MASAREQGYKYDSKTGRKVRLDRMKSRRAKIAARKRKHKRMSAATKLKISKVKKKEARTGRTKSGRRVVKPRKAPAKKKA